MTFWGMGERYEINFECSHMKSTAKGKIKIIFTITIGPTDKKYVFDDPHVYQLDSIAEGTIEACIQHFHIFNYKCEYETNEVLEENGENEANFTITNSYRNLVDSIDEQIELEAKIVDYGQGENGCSFDSINKLALRTFRYQDRGLLVIAKFLYNIVMHNIS